MSGVPDPTPAREATAAIAPAAAAVPDRLAAALAYCARGWVPIPVCSPDGNGACREHRGKWRGHDGPGKVSLTRWSAWAQCKPTVADVERFWRGRWHTANVGLLTGTPSGFVAFDADDDVARAFLARFDAPRIVTGRGEHALFAAPAGTPVRSAAKIGEMNLDVRGDGGYIVAPPSEHENGSRYAWKAGRPPEPGELPPIPGELFELLPHSKRPAEQAPPRRFRLRPELLAAALLQPDTMRLPGGTVRIRCPHPDHTDAHPSGELHEDGSLTCYSHPGRRTTWPPHVWAAWPKGAWAAPFVETRGGRPGAFRVPDTLARAAWATTPVPMLARRERRDTLTIDGRTIRDPLELAHAVRDRCGTDGPRVLVLLAAAMQLQAGDDRLRGLFRPRYGEAWWSPRDGAELLGLSPAIGGARLDALDGTVRALGTIKAGFSISFERDGQPATRTFRGPLVGDTQIEVEDRLPDGYTRRGRVVRLHESIAYGASFGRCYADLPIGVLRLHDSASFLAALVLARELRRRGGVIDTPLPDLLALAGVPHDDLRGGGRRHPARAVGRWRRRLDGIATVLDLADCRIGRDARLRARTTRGNLDAPGAILDAPGARPHVFRVGNCTPRHVDHVYEGTNDTPRALSGPVSPVPFETAARVPPGGAAASAALRVPPQPCPAGPFGPAATAVTSPGGDRLQLAVPGCGASPVALADLERAEDGRRRQAEAERRADRDREQERNQRDAEQAARRQLPITAGGHTR